MLLLLMVLLLSFAASRVRPIAVGLLLVPGVVRLVAGGGCLLLHGELFPLPGLLGQLMVLFEVQLILQLELNGVEVGLAAGRDHVTVGLQRR